MKYFSNVTILAIITATAACGSKNTKKGEESVDQKTVVTDPTIVETAPSQVDETVAATTPAPALTADFGLDGFYFSENFYSASPAVSRSHLISGDKFTSTVTGIAPGTMTVIAFQEESGTLKQREEGNGIDLVVEKSSCDGVPDFVSNTARRLNFTALKLDGSALNFKFVTLDVERDGSLAQVDSIPEFAIADGQLLQEACWYYGANGELRAGILEFLPKASAQ